MYLNLRPERGKRLTGRHLFGDRWSWLPVVLYVLFLGYVLVKWSI